MLANESTVLIRSIPHVLCFDNVYRPSGSVGASKFDKQLYRNPITDCIDPAGRGNVGHRKPKANPHTDTCDYVLSAEYARRLSAQSAFIDARVAALPLV